MIIIILIIDKWYNDHTWFSMLLLSWRLQAQYNSSTTTVTDVKGL